MADHNSPISRRAHLVSSIRRRTWTWAAVTIFSVVLFIIMVTSAVAFAHRHVTGDQPRPTAAPTSDIFPQALGRPTTRTTSNYSMMITTIVMIPHVQLVKTLTPKATASDSVEP
ncbi:hypothetical protein BDV96DRAFT_644615 [Lophiotrema nucula]|uniref:Uncharacterized protein n=1 Tax=Lophiotrema nucula TaxID=690887 RepID=A0A6A5ZDP1_9PLEO|nr:hypothetical protein BDV96DRAFT_644615 [Lophiotrema nucula]